MNWKKQRSQSFFYSMRKFHNQIKRELYNKYTKGIAKLLEISVGKFGDLGKIYANDVKSVVGYDIDSVSISEGKRRLEEYPFDFKKNVCLHVLDLSKNVVSGNKEFDVVSAQFCLPYFFKDQDSFLTVMKTVSNNLKVGGFFMGTMFDGDTVNKRLEHSFEDSHFKVVKGKHTGDVFGNAINVCLLDDQRHAKIYNPEDEYVVNFECFTHIMKMNGFTLVESNMFKDLHYNRLHLTDTEKDVSFLYRTFVFQRTKAT